MKHVTSKMELSAVQLNDVANCACVRTRSIEPTRDCVATFSEGCSTFKRQLFRSSLDQVINTVADQCDPLVQVGRFSVAFIKGEGNIIINISSSGLSSNRR